MGACQHLAQVWHNSAADVCIITYNFRQPRQRWQQCGRCLSLAIYGIEYENEAAHVELRRVLEQFGELESQLCKVFTSCAGSVLANSLCHFSQSSLKKMPSRDAF